MFIITVISKGESSTYTFDTLKKAQGWLAACATTYETITLVIQFDRTK